MAVEDHLRAPKCDGCKKTSAEVGTLHPTGYQATDSRYCGSCARRYGLDTPGRDSMG